MFRLPCDSHLVRRSGRSEQPTHTNKIRNKNNKSFTLLDQKYSSLFLN